MAVLGPPWLGPAGAILQSQCGGFLLRWLLLSRSTGSRTCMVHQLWLPGSRAQAQQQQHRGLAALQMWDLPRPGVESCLLHQQAGSLPLSHQGSPETHYFLKLKKFILSQGPMFQNFMQKESFSWPVSNQIPHTSPFLGHNYPYHNLHNHSYKKKKNKQTNSRSKEKRQ